MTGLPVPTFAERNNLLGTTEEVLDHMFGPPQHNSHVAKREWHLYMLSIGYSDYLQDIEKRRGRA